MSDDQTDSARRAFLEKCGKFAIVTPPVVTMMLATDSTRKALAASGVSSVTTTTAFTMLHDQEPSGKANDLAMVVDSMGVMKPS